MRSVCVFIIFFLLSPFAFSANAASSIPAEAKAFFDRYVALSDNFDPAVTALYSDSAVITSDRRYPHGAQREFSLSGSDFKQMMAVAMPLAKRQGDKSLFDRISISEFPGGARIKARRYSTRKCYYDEGYFMDIAQLDTGEFTIMREQITTRPLSSCPQ